jgi:ABC-2 type transport system permease protein
MGLTPLLAMVWKDLQVHYTDRRAVIMGFVAPIAIASFLGSLFGGSGAPREPAKIPIAIVDQDGSVISKGVVANASADRILNVTSPTVDEARASVRRGDVTVAVVIPAGFGEASGLAFFGGGERPPVTVLYDPSHAAEMALVRGMLTQHVMEVVSREMFSGSAGRQMVERTLRNLDGANMPDDQRALLRTLMMAAQGLNARTSTSGDAAAAPRGISLPYTVTEEAITGQNVAYN